MFGGSKVIFGSIGALVGAGGITGLAHSTPTILWKNGITCRNIGVTFTDASQLSRGVWVQWEDGGGFSNLREVSSVGTEPDVCYKR